MGVRTFFVGGAVGGLVLLAGCSKKLDGPEPVVDALTPSLVCGDQLVTEIVIAGDELSPLGIDQATDDSKLAIPDVLVERVSDLMGGAVSGPSVTLPNDPANPASARVRWTSQQQMAFDVYPELGLEPGLYDVTVTNRNGNSARLAGALAVVSEPTLDSIVPDLTCLEQGMRSMTLTGTGFLQVGSELPTVIFSSGGTDESYTADAVSDCFDLPGPTQAQLCTSIQVTVPEDGLVIGAHDVVVMNPAPASCDTSNDDPVTMAVAPRPTLTSAEPDLVCSEDGPEAMTLTGTGFVALRDGGGDTFPSVTIGGETVTVTSATNCGAVDGTLLAAESCTTLTVEVPSGLTVVGDQPVVVTNPDPAGCNSEESVSVLILGAPEITGFEPAAVCSTSQPNEIFVVGAGFLRLEDANGDLIDPTVTVDGVAVTITFDANDCTALTSSIATGQICTRFSIPAPGAGFTDGSHPVVVTNPAPADCSDTANFTVASAPTVSQVDPFKVCTDGGSFTVTGTGFVNGSEILLDGTPVMTTFVSATQLTGTISAGFTADTYDVSVRNGAGCESNTLVGAVRAVDAPVAFFVDPSTIYSGPDIDIDMRITVWVSGIEGSSPRVFIRQNGTMNTPIELANPEYNGTNRIFATVLDSLNLTPALYDVIIEDDPCDTELLGGLTVTDDLSVYVSDIDPAFGVSSTDPNTDPTVDNTGVTVFSDMATTPGGFDNFKKTPRVYLNPTSGTDPATELKAVQWLDNPYRLEGVVPAALAAGDYQVIVINPDGGVGALQNKFFKMLPNDDPPPVITAVLPGQVTDTTGQNVSVIGEHFPTVLADVAVTARCRDPDAVDPAATEVLRTATVNTTDATLIATTWDMSNLNGFTCVVRVTNLANASFADFSAITVVNASGNIPPFFASNRLLNDGRRALSGAAIRMNTTSRYLFAIGGDDGAGTPTRFSSVESAPLDPFGAIIADFSIQRNTLPEERAFASGAAAVIGRYVYLAGGRAGVAPGTVDGKLLRGYLLDPFESPEITDLDLVLLDGAGGLPTGLWHYRVAAVMDDGAVVAADANNPGGEGLPSETLAVQIPGGLAQGVELTLYWQHIEGAVKYRVYRTKAPGGIAGEEVILAEMNAQSAPSGACTVDCNVIDDGGTPLAVQSLTDAGIDNSAVDATVVTNLPMPLGSLGVWHQVGTLNTPREGAAIVAVPNYICVLNCGAATPVYIPDPTRSFLYVLGGRNGATYLDDIEWIQVDTLASNVQNLVDPLDATGSAFRVSAQVLPNTGARWLLGAVYLDGRKSTQIGVPNAFIYALPGENGAAGNNAVNRVTAIAVDTGDGTNDGIGADGDGSLTGATDVNAPNAKFTGYGYVANHNFLHVIGGQTGAPSTSGMKSFVLSPPPGLDPWDAGTQLSTARHMHATAHESAFVFQLGGTTTQPASRTVEQSNF
ncbi:MAG TPA: IPT/TIG domain-containing protein [Kofleriaceae bacterium]|nr:IPT/TIG domain-containing protein [Kofleriaceae bacterium]